MNTSKFTSWPVSADCSMPKFLERDKQMGQERTELWIAVKITSEFICSLALMLKTIRPLNLPTVSCIFCELRGQTLSYLHVREVFKTQMKSRDTSKSYVCFVYDVSSVFSWQGNADFPTAGLEPLLFVCIWALNHLPWRWSMKNEAPSFLLYIYIFQMPGA